jgi:hypothetical protein
MNRLDQIRIVILHAAEALAHDIAPRSSKSEELQRLWCLLAERRAHVIQQIHPDVVAAYHPCGSGIGLSPCIP